MSREKRNCVLILGSSMQRAGIGGVSIHVQRLCQWLSYVGYPFDFCDYKATTLWTQVKEIQSHTVVHIHSNNPLITLFYVLTGRLARTKTILTIHGNLGRLSKCGNFLRELAIKLCDTPILLNNSSYQLSLKWNRHSVLMSAFILPVDDGELPESIEQKVSVGKSNGKIIVATNAYKRVFSDSGDEIYGIDFLINYFKDKNNYQLCISDPSGQYSEEYSDRQYDNIIFISEPHSFFRLLGLADIMIRATSTDGDSLSVKEGMVLRKKVIVTDCVDRPDGVILFRYNDSESLSKALATETVPSEMEFENGLASLIKLYDRTLTE